MDHGYSNDGFTTFSEVLVVLPEQTITIEPAESAFDDQTAGKIWKPCLSSLRLTISNALDIEVFTGRILLGGACPKDTRVERGRRCR
jgi:hypothetical protein